MLQQYSANYSPKHNHHYLDQLRHRYNHRLGTQQAPCSRREPSGALGLGHSTGRKTQRTDVSADYRRGHYASLKRKTSTLLLMKPQTLDQYMSSKLARESVNYNTLHSMGIKEQTFKNIPEQAYNVRIDQPVTDMPSQQTRQYENQDFQAVFKHLDSPIKLIYKAQASADQDHATKPLEQNVVQLKEPIRLVKEREQTIRVLSRVDSILTCIRNTLYK